MARLLPFKSRRNVEEEASQWLSRMDRGLEDEERTALEAWLRADRRHARALIAMAALWDDMELMRELSGLMELPACAPSALPAYRMYWLASAAAVPVLLVGLWLLKAGTAPSAPPSVSTGAVAASAPPTSRTSAASDARSPRYAYRTRVGEQRTEALPDGSIVQLNTATQVVATFRESERDVEVLAGEAHFEVQHDASRPFIVTAGSRRIRAVGTAFNVRLDRGGGMAVTVTEGQILVTSIVPSAAAKSGPVSSPVHEARVNAGQQLQADGPDREWRVHSMPPLDMSNQLAWQRGMLIFDGEPLEIALAEVSRYTDTRFEVRDESLRSIRVGGFYKSGDIDALIRSLERNLGIVAVREPGGRVVLDRKVAAPKP